MECRKTYERMSILGNVFDCQHARRDPDELFNYSRILATSWGIVDDFKDSEEKKELRLVGVKNHCNQYLYLASQYERGEKSGRQISLMSMTNHALGIWICTQVAWQFRVISPRKCICQKFSDQEEFQSWIVNFQVEVCAKAKNLALVLQWIKRSKQPVHWRTSSIHNQLREKISRIMKNWIWWWRQDWNGATMLFVWSTKLPSVEPWQDKRAKNYYTERNTWRMFSAENNWVLFKKGHDGSFLHTWCHGRPWW